ncbi:hypothetical protein PEBR_01684 [Penicillium brasilianum]|uniref:RanBP2-type domain-containing protein n=1 Tax=Penicillium brasilianum TaxID=104259 RepID=A0A1S9S0F2_PENBI|nr:hypothetical protein PEBR_01684 [Penicillium brasilianum]
MQYNNLFLTDMLEATMSFLPDAITSPFPGPQIIDENVDDDYLLISQVQVIQPIYSGIRMNAVWWVCSECSSMNNPALAPERCSVCQHYKCGSCSSVVV